MDVSRLEDLPREVKALLGRIERIDRPVQGATSQVWLIQCEYGARVIKFTDRAPFDDWLRQEYAVLEALRSSGLPVPEPYLLHEQDGVYVVMQQLAGEPLSQVMARTADSEIRLELMREFGRALRRIHDTPSPLPRGDWLIEQLATAEGYLARYPVEGTAELLERLQRERPAPVPQVLIHGDFMWDNVLVAAGRVSGVIDWGGGAYGDPRYDLALALLPHEDGDISAEEIEAFYEAYGGAQLSAAEVEYFVGLYAFF
jgi:aminoglycoside phosphotransferase (APT) family kinase protein